MGNKNKFIVEVKTNSRGWVRAELIKRNNDGTVLVQLKTGEIIRRHFSKGIRYGKVNRIPQSSERFSNKKELKLLRSTRKRRKRKKPKNKYYKGKMKNESDKRFD